MSRIRLIARRELFSIMGGPVGLTLMALYLALAGYLFSMDVARIQEATLRYIFGTLGLMTVFVVPLLTMRLFSEELRAGTFELLTTHPVTDLELVLGKFLAGWAAFALLSAPTLSYIVVLQVLGSPDWGPALCGYAGQQLLAAMLTAIGMLISALTSSQALAALGAMVVGILLTLAGTAAGSVEGFLGSALSYLAIMDHFSLFRRGVLDSRAIVYFLGSTTLFLYLAVRAVESRRWKFGVIPGAVPGAWKSPRTTLACVTLALLLTLGMTVSRLTGGVWSWVQGLQAFGIALALAIPTLMNAKRLRYLFARRQFGIALTVVVNCLMVVLIWGMVTFLTSRHYARLDLTQSRRYALSPQTQQVIAGLTTPVDLFLSAPKTGDLRQDVDDLLSEYQARSAKLVLHRLDPVDNPGEEEQLRERYKLTSTLANELMVVLGDHVRRIPLSAMVRQKISMNNGQRVHGPVQFVGEAELTSALIQLGRSTPGRVAFLSGHGEHDLGDTGERGVANLGVELKRNGWAVDRHVVTPGASARFSPETSVVIVAGPQKALSNEDLEALEQLLARGGGVVFLLDAGTVTGLDPLLNQWELRVTNELVVDMQDHLGSSDPTGLYVTRFMADHPIGKGMGSLAAVLPTTQRIGMNAHSQNPNVYVNAFMASSGNSWAVPYTPGEQSFHVDRVHNKRGPLALGVACERMQAAAAPGEKPLQGRIVVIGDSDFASNQYSDMAGNMNLLLNAVDWAGGRPELVGVRPKLNDMRMLTLTRGQVQMVFWVCVLVVPLAATLLGALVLVNRRRKA